MKALGYGYEQLNMLTKVTMKIPEVYNEKCNEIP